MQKVLQLQIGAEENTAPKTVWGRRGQPLTTARHRQGSLLFVKLSSSTRKLQVLTKMVFPVLKRATLLLWVSKTPGLQLGQLS